MGGCANETFGEASKIINGLLNVVYSAVPGFFTCCHGNYTHYHTDSLLWTVIPKLYPQVPPETLNEAVLREGRVFCEI